MGLFTAIGSVFAKGAADDSAAAQERAGAIQLQAAKANKGIYYDRAETAEFNAKHVEWQGKYTASRLRSQAKINELLSSSEFEFNLRQADIVEQSARNAGKQGRAQQAQFDLEAKDVLDTGAARGTRMFRQGLEATGRQRVAIASAGFVESGSELGALVESANRANLAILDNAKASAGEARRLAYGGKVAAYEGDVAEFQGVNEAANARYSAATSKFMSDVEGWNDEQEALVAIYEGKVGKRNYLSEARDLRKQGDLSEMYGMAAYESAKAGADATRAHGTAQMISGVGGWLEDFYKS